MIKQGVRFRTVALIEIVFGTQIPDYKRINSGLANFSCVVVRIIHDPPQFPCPNILLLRLAWLPNKQSTTANSFRHLNCKSNNKGEFNNLGLNDGTWLSSSPNKRSQVRNCYVRRQCQSVLFVPHPSAPAPAIIATASENTFQPFFHI